MCSSFSLKTVKLANNLNLITLLQNCVLQTKLMAKMLLNFSGNRIRLLEPRPVCLSIQNFLRIGIASIFAMVLQPLVHMAGSSTSMAPSVKSRFSRLPVSIPAVPGTLHPVARTPKQPCLGSAAGGFTC